LLNEKRKEKKVNGVKYLYFYPPESLTPLSPTIVFNPSGKSYLLLTNSAALAIAIAS
jgi:hypothetical protein